MNTPYIYLGDKQTAGTSELAEALMALIEEFCLTDTQIEKVHEILNDNGVSYE
jgi:hypothetical protein